VRTIAGAALVSRQGASTLFYFIWKDGRVIDIRDFRYASYVAKDAELIAAD